MISYTKMAQIFCSIDDFTKDICSGRGNYISGTIPLIQNRRF